MDLDNRPKTSKSRSLSLGNESLREPLFHNNFPGENSLKKKSNMARKNLREEEVIGNRLLVDDVEAGSMYEKIRKINICLYTL